MENYYLVFIAFLKIFKGMVLTFFVSGILLFIFLRVKVVLETSRHKTFLNRFITGGLRK
jgi:predicted PurR-regulated permease PerM